MGQFAIQSAWMFGAERVIAIDRIPERLGMAESQSKADTINFNKENVYDRLMEKTGGRGPDRCIDAVGTEADVSSLIPSSIGRRSRHIGEPIVLTFCAKR